MKRKFFRQTTSLLDFNHKNILLLEGIIIRNQIPLAAYTWTGNGNLKEYLGSVRKEIRVSDDSCSRDIHAGKGLIKHFKQLEQWITFSATVSGGPVYKMDTGWSRGDALFVSQGIRPWRCRSQKLFVSKKYIFTIILKTIL